MNEYSLRAAAEDAGARTALRFESETLSWAALADRARRLGASIDRANAGTAAPVALRATNRAATAVALYAMFERGITVVPLHPRLTDAEAKALADDAGCALRLDDGALDALDARDVAEDAAAVRTDRPLAILYTSGTTGTPKGAVLSREAFVASARASEANLGWREDDRWLLCLPLCHVGGLSVLTRCLFARKTVVLQRRFDERASLYAIEREGVTIASFVPTMLQRLIEADDGAALSKLRAVLLGGAASSSALLEACARRGLRVRTTYGLTEACSQVTTQSDRDFTVVEQGCGAPLAGTELRVTRDDGAPCDAGEVGRLSLRGPTLFSGYHRAESRTPEQWFDTGDYGTLDARGLLHVVARRTDLIVTGGENVYPLEVERALDGIEGVRGSMVFGVEDPRWGQLVACALVTDDRFDRRRFADECAKVLAVHKRPRRLVLCDALPLTAANKPDRRAARSRFSDALEDVAYASGSAVRASE
jgi:O-succinylbenzoic acid--CoA ligase